VELELPCRMSTGRPCPNEASTTSSTQRASNTPDGGTGGSSDSPKDASTPAVAPGSIPKGSVSDLPASVLTEIVASISGVSWPCPSPGKHKSTPTKSTEAARRRVRAGQQRIGIVLTVGGKTEPRGRPVLDLASLHLAFMVARRPYSRPCIADTALGQRQEGQGCPKHTPAASFFTLPSVRPIAQQLCQSPNFRL
jgi:hypothetical protein